MIDTILGSKLNMSQAYEGAVRVGVTAVQAGPCVVTQIKHTDKDGYWAVQLGFSNRKAKNTSKPLQGHFKNIKDKKQTDFPRHLKEVRFETEPEFKVGDKITLADIFSVGDTVQVTGFSKGKGWAGVIKRWGFAGGSKTHGQSDRHRAPGSIGQGTTPGRVYKGKKMAGRMGSDQVTVRNLKVVEMNPETNTMSIKGSIPGSPNTLLVIKRTSERKVEDKPVEGETNDQN